MAFLSTYVTLLSGATSSNAPSLTDATAGQPFPFSADQALVLVKSTAGSGTMTALLILWGYNPATSTWYSIGTLNGGVAIAETTADAINYAELVKGLRRFSRLYCQISSLGGTNTAVTVTADFVPSEPVSR